ncbi:hypothetical protein BGZ96_007186 [Linnemannia gamsii]|uniref:Uncharacterized protein n=1 Tax=Linnemannia gamsii TaxID=64522 RepID=A0ABQ7K110_9FUNG|nr:hypothetical protein BGZ96_007186 [Linnemannia gamsii]
MANRHFIASAPNCCQFATTSFTSGSTPYNPVGYNLAVAHAYENELEHLQTILFRDDPVMLANLTMTSTPSTTHIHAKQTIEDVSNYCNSSLTDQVMAAAYELTNKNDDARFHENKQCKDIILD